MQTRARRDHLVIGLSLLALVAALGTASVGFVLAEVYKPQLSRLPGDLPSFEQRGSATWSDWHRHLSLLFLASSIVLSAVLAWFVHRARLSAARSAVLLVSSGLAVLTAIVTMSTRPLVEWDQLALWAVTNDFDSSGYRPAAFDDGVRFLLIDGREVSKDDDAVALLVHLGAPVVGIVTLLIATVASVQFARTRSASTAMTETSESVDASMP